MRGLNQKLKAEITDGAELKVHSIFLTLQGEGPYSGQQAAFVRLSGCNLACYFCDTEFETFSVLECDAIINSIQCLSNNTKLVVITGGEPLRQSIGLLCSKLIALGYRVQIESNGTIYQHIPEDVEIVCSPKIINEKYCVPDPRIWRHIIALKFIISASSSEYSKLPEKLLDEAKKRGIKVYVQPMDEYTPDLNKINMLRCIALAHQYNVTMSVQLHKILNIA